MLQKELAKRLKARYDTKMDGNGWLEVSSDDIPPLPDKIQRSISKQCRPKPLRWIPQERRCKAMSRLDFLYRTELPHRAVAVYIYLADRTNENNECWPTIPTIAADLKLSASTVRRGIRDLKKAGRLATEQRYRKKGGKSSLLFRLKSEWKKQNAPPRGNCAYTLTGAIVRFWSLRPSAVFFLL